MKPEEVTFSLPLFDQFFDRLLHIPNQFPPSNPSLVTPDEIGVMDGFRVRSPNHFRHGGYWCTPLNTLEFASTGMDGEHFSFLVQEGRIDDQSPIVFTAPCNYGNEAYNIILASTFRTFLQLGIRYGFSALGELAYNPEEAIPKFTSPSWRPDTHHTTYNNPEQQDIINWIADQLALDPYIYAPQEFERLQQRYQPTLIMGQVYLDNERDP